MATEVSKMIARPLRTSWELPYSSWKKAISYCNRPEIYPRWNEYIRPGREARLRTCNLKLSRLRNVHTLRRPDSIYANYVKETMPRDRQEMRPPFWERKPKNSLLAQIIFTGLALFAVPFALGAFPRLKIELHHLCACVCKCACAKKKKTL